MDSASQVQFQPSPSKCTITSTGATGQVALPKTWKALNIACRMPGNTAHHPKKNGKKKCEASPQKEDNTMQQRDLFLKDAEFG